MMSSLQRYWLDHTISKFVDLDKFNLDIDNSISYDENKSIITKQLRQQLNPQELVEAGMYEPDFDQLDDACLFATPKKTLTTKQRKILDLLLLGYSQREIAKKIGKARETVKKHFQAIKKKGYAIKISYNKYRYIKPDEVSG